MTNKDKAPPDRKVDGDLRSTSDRASGENLSGDRVPSSDDSPGVPGFRTWRGVYLFVFGCFVAVVILLAVFTRVFA